MYFQTELDAVHQKHFMNKEEVFQIVISLEGATKCSQVIRNEVMSENFSLLKQEGLLSLLSTRKLAEKEILGPPLQKKKKKPGRVLVGA